MKLILKTKRIYIIHSLVFMLCLLLPLLFADFRGGAVSVKENRVLSARPPMSDMFKQTGAFLDKFEAWFSDNIGFREVFIDAYEEVAKLGNQSGNVEYRDGQYVMLVGEEGHHYFAYTDGWMIDKFRGKTFLSESELVGLVDGLNSINNYLEHKNIPLITMFCADKEEIYPEFYPKSIRQASGSTQLEIISDYVNEHSNMDFFNIKECLLEAKEKYPVFDKNSDDLSHYNEIGAFFTYQELMKHVAKYFPDMKALNLDDVTITYKDEEIYTNIPDIELKQKPDYTQLGEEFFAKVPINNTSSDLAFQNEDTTLPTLLLLRDSYAGNGTMQEGKKFLSQYLPEHFGKTIMLHWNNMSKLETYVDYFKPDIVIFESAERELKGFAENVSELQGLE